MKKSQKRLWVGLLILALFTPIGIILPERFKAGSAWGEWGPKELEKLAGYIPEGLKQLTGFWKAPAPEYGIVGGTSMTSQVISYVLSGFVGILVICLVIYVISRLVLKNGK